MKKIIIASLVFLMMGAAVIYAESTSLVGRKVQSEAVITLDGQEIGSVLILDGVSYAPVRVIAEASGLNAGYKKGEVSLTSVEPSDTTINVEELTKERRLLSLRADFLVDAISDSEYVINRHKEAIAIVDETSVDFYVEALSQAIQENAEYEAELVQVNVRIAEIDALLK